MQLHKVLRGLIILTICLGLFLMGRATAPSCPQDAVSQSDDSFVYGGWQHLGTMNADSQEAPEFDLQPFPETYMNTMHVWFLTEASGTKQDLERAQDLLNSIPNSELPTKERLEYQLRIDTLLGEIRK